MSELNEKITIDTDLLETLNSNLMNREATFNTINKASTDEPTKNAIPKESIL